MNKHSIFPKYLFAILAISVSSDTYAAINFENPYVFVSREQAERGFRLPLTGSRERDLSYVSVRVFKWTQEGRQNVVLTPTNDVAVYPEMLRLDPDTRASVAIKFKPFAAPVNEIYYRVVMEEFDSPTADAGKEESARISVRVRPRVTLPLVIFGKGPISPPILSAKSAAAKTNAEQSNPSFVVSNTGGTYARIVGFRTVDRKLHPVLAYVLPNSTVEVAVPGISNGTAGEFVFTAGRAEHGIKSSEASHSIQISS